MSRICSRSVVVATPSAVLVRAAAVAVMSTTALVAAATASSAVVVEGTTTATVMDSPVPAGFQILGMPVATIVWLFVGVIAVLAGLIVASRSARSGGGAAALLLSAGVDDAAFGSDARVTMGDADGDQS